MIRNLAILIVLLAAIGGYTLYDSISHKAPVSAAQPKDAATASRPAPDFSFATLNGKKHTLSDFKGKIIVLNFWATWCAPCVIEFPQMVRLAKETKNETVFVFLSVDDDDAVIERFLKKYVPEKTDNVLIARDADKSVSAQLYQTYKLPETYIIDKDFGIREKIIGADVDWLGDDMRGKIR